MSLVYANTRSKHQGPLLVLEDPPKRRYAPRYVSHKPAWFRACESFVESEGFEFPVETAEETGIRRAKAKKAKQRRALRGKIGKAARHRFKKLNESPAGALRRLEGKPPFGARGPDGRFV